MKPDFDAIKRTTDIVRVIENYGVALKKTGQDHVGLCPFHEDKKPSLQVSASKGLWHCMACGAAGNVIQFVARKEGIAEREAALKLLGTMPGVTTANKLPRPQPSPPPAAQIDEATRAKLLGRVANFYARTLAKDRAGLDYLKTRCLDDAAALDTFQVGYCNGSMRKALPREGKVIEQLKAIGVLNERGNEVFYRRIVVPVHDAEGNVAGLYGRRIGDQEPRHIYLKGERRGIFNRTAAKGSKSLIIVESIFDAISLWVAGFRNVIALGGKDGWREEHAALIRENQIADLYLAFDNDDAGRAGAERLAPELAGLGVAVHRIAWPEGVKDANAFFPSRTPEDFAAMLKAANPQSEPVVNANEQRLGKEAIEPGPDGFTASYGEGAAVRRYQLCAIEKPSPSRLKATVKALAEQASRFVIDTLDFYSLRSKRAFIAEAARLFRQTVEVIEADVNRLTVAAEEHAAQRQSTVTLPAVTDAERA